MTDSSLSESNHLINDTATKNNLLNPRLIYKIIPTELRACRNQIPSKAVLVRDEYRCQKCGREDSLHVHHIRAVCEEGTNDMDNLIALCSGCHKEWHCVEETSFLTMDLWIRYPPVHRLIVMLETVKGSPLVTAESLETMMSLLCLK